MANAKLVFSLILAGLVVLFLVQNTAVVEVRFMFWAMAMSRALMIFLVFAFGILAGWLLHSHMVVCRPGKNDGSEEIPD